jgi:hypothetical protein
MKKKIGGDENSPQQKENCERRKTPEPDERIDRMTHTSPSPPRRQRKKISPSATEEVVTLSPYTELPLFSGQNSLLSLIAPQSTMQLCEKHHRLHVPFFPRFICLSVWVLS